MNDSQTAAELLRKLKDADVLVEVRAGSGRRSALYGFIKLIQVAERGTME